MSIERLTGQWAAGGYWWDVVIDINSPDGADTLTLNPTPLRFSTDVGILEWKKCEKYDVIESAALDLTVVSPGDRTYAGLYARRPGEVSIALRRGDIDPSSRRVVWHGTLDCEFYSEPYREADGYDVSLTFGDLGCLSRLDFDIRTTGLVTVDALVRGALEAAGLPDAYTLHTTLEWNGSPVSLGRLSIDPANFYDEDDEPMSWAQVLESVLQPLGLKIRQGFDGVVVYDLEYCHDHPDRIIEWYPESGTLGVDKVYRSVAAEVSPYSSASVLDGLISHDDLKIKSPSTLRFNHVITGDSATDNYPSFEVEFGREADGDTCGGITINPTNGAAFFRINRLFDGTEYAGVSGLIRGNMGANRQDPVQGWMSNPLHRSAAGDFDTILPLFSLTPGRITLGHRRQFCLRVKMDLLFDTRYNPFTEAGIHNEEGHYNNIQKKHWLVGLIPVKIWLEGDDGNTYHWRNTDAYPFSLINYEGLSAATLPGGDNARWTRGAPAWGDCWLTYYDWKREESPFSAVATNRQYIAPAFTATNKVYSSTTGFIFDIPAWWKQRGDGEFLPLPPVSGILHFEVGRGLAPLHPEGTSLYIWDYDNSRAAADTSGGMTSPRWLLYMNPVIDITDPYGQEPGASDLQHRAELSQWAENELSIPLTCSSSQVDTPQARSVYRLDGSPLYEIKRGGYVAPPEKLLLYSLAGQYDTRHDVLTGSIKAEKLDGAPGSWTGIDGDTPRYLLTACALNLSAATAECTFTELSPTVYTPITTE